MGRLLSFSDMCQRVSYYDYYDTRLKKKDGTSVKGTLYKLDRLLSNEERAEFTAFRNVRLFVSQCQYAPEIKRSCIFLAKKSI